MLEKFSPEWYLQILDDFINEKGLFMDLSTWAVNNGHAETISDFEELAESIMSKIHEED